MYRRQLRTYDGRIVARIEQTVLIKGLDGKIRESQHMLRVPKAWAFDECLIEQADELDCNLIKVVTSDTNLSYIVGMNEFQENKFKIDRGHNPQWGLTIGHWDVFPTGGFIESYNVNMLKERPSTVNKSSGQMKLF